MTKVLAWIGGIVGVLIIFGIFAFVFLYILACGMGMPDCVF